MPNVEFDENNLPMGRFTPGVGQSPGLVKLVIKLGIAKDERNANYVLIGIAVCAILLTIFVLKNSFSGSRSRQNSAIIPIATFPAR